MYRDKVVCFIDILGFAELVMAEPQTPEKIFSILSKIRTALKDWSNVEVSQNIDLQITQFSDSLVFSFIPTIHYFMTFSFFKELAITMINEGVVFRGGITYGEIYHDPDFVFGPAMNEAYRLESKVAEFPRIVIDELAMELKNDKGKTIKDYPGQFVFKIEKDGYSHIDYIFDVYPYVMDQIGYYQRLKLIIEKGLSSLYPRVKAKYAWMKEEYNSAKMNFPDLVLIP